MPRGFHAPQWLRATQRSTSRARAFQNSLTAQGCTSTAIHHGEPLLSDRLLFLTAKPTSGPSRLVPQLKRGSSVVLASSPVGASRSALGAAGLRLHAGEAVRHLLKITSVEWEFRHCPTGHCSSGETALRWHLKLLYVRAVEAHLAIDVLCGRDRGRGYTTDRPRWLRCRVLRYAAARSCDVPCRCLRDVLPGVR